MVEARIAHLRTYSSAGTCQRYVDVLGPLDFRTIKQKIQLWANPMEMLEILRPGVNN